MFAALAHKKEGGPASVAVKDVARGMTEEQIGHFTRTKAKDLPEKKASLVQQLLRRYAR